MLRGAKKQDELIPGFTPDKAKGKKRLPNFFAAWDDME